MNELDNLNVFENVFISIKLYLLFFPLQYFDSFSKHMAKLLINLKNDLSENEISD